MRIEGSPMATAPTTAGTIATKTSRQLTSSATMPARAGPTTLGRTQAVDRAA